MTNLFSIENRIILVSGSTGVLGSAISKYLAGEGAHIIILGRNEAKVKDLVKEIEDEGGKAFYALADVTKEEELEAAKQHILSEFKSIDVLINAAGGNMPGAIVMPEQSILESDTEALRQVMELNYLGTFLPVKAFLPLFEETKKGSIINISSMSASRPLTRVMGYSSAKAAIENLTKWLSIEFATKQGEGMRVNAVAPGFFLTDQNKSLLIGKNGNLTERGKQIIAHTPMKRLGRPSELFGAVHWLSSDASKFVTGTVIPVDGGFGANSGI